MKSFRYPEKDHELFDYEYARDFLRSPDDFPDRVDFNYLRNQRDAVNHFIDWFDGNKDQSYVEMLRRSHQLAAVGYSGASVYTIRWNDELLIPSIAEDGTIQFETFDRHAFRETQPGLFRSELLDAGIPHPAKDLFELTEDEFHGLSALGDSSFGAELEWCRTAERASRGIGSTGKYLKHFHEVGARLEVTITESGDLVCHNPTGHDYQVMRELCETWISRIKRDWHSKSSVKMIDYITSYYHAAINWMPFSNINNSILMAQMNSLRRRLGVDPLAHNNLDTLALLTDQNGFLRLIP